MVWLRGAFDGIARALDEMGRCSTCRQSLVVVSQTPIWIDEQLTFIDAYGCPRCDQ